MKWSIKRAYDGRGGWIPCLADSENAGGIVFAGRQEATEETIRRNACERFEIRQEELVVGFKGHDGNLVCFLVGISRAESDEGWVLYHGVPVKANICDISSNYSDCMVVEDKQILTRVTYSTGVEQLWPEYACFDLSDLPDNVTIMDAPDDSPYDENEDDEPEILYEQDHVGMDESLLQEDEDISQEYELPFDATIDPCVTLLKAATPELYRDNAFRVLGLLTTATTRDIERHQRNLKMSAKLGIGSTGQDQRGYLPLPPPDDDAIQRATERLRDPESRFIDEFFWFWTPRTASARDEALDLLFANRVNETAGILEQQKEHDATGITSHNLAVLYHARALDFEHRAATDGFTKGELETCGRWWKGAYREWRQLLNNESFWSQVTARIRELNDPRLTTGLARRIRHSLPKAIFQINALLAVRAAEEADEATCNYHIQLAREFGFGKELLDAVLGEVITPIRHRIRMACDRLRGNTDVKTGHGNLLAWEFLLESRPLLKIVDLLLAEGGLLRESVHDEIAGTVTDAAISYVNATEDWDEGIALLLQAQNLALSESLRARIKKNLNTATYWGMHKRESKALKHTEAEKMESVSHSGRSIAVKCALAKERAESTPETADRVIWQLLLETKPVLQTLKGLTSDRDDVLIAANDEVADTVLQCQILYGNRTKNWKQCVMLLMSVYDFPISESLRSRIKENLSRLNENSRQEQEYEDLKQAMAENRAFVVSVSGANVTMPAVCSCCLGPAETVQEVSKAQTAEDGRYEGTRALKFPLCMACVQHQKDLRWKRTIFVLLAIALPVAASYLIGFESGGPNYLEFMILGGLLFVVIFSMLVGSIRAKKLSPRHASGGPAVALDNVGAGCGTFRFWNPSYAHAFAQANNSRAIATKVSKYSRDLHFVRGGAFVRRASWIVACVLVGQSAVYGLLSATQWHRLSPRTVSNPRIASSQTYSHTEQRNRGVSDKGPPTGTYVPVEPDGSLLAEINQGKGKLRRMESELEEMDSRLETLSTRLNTRKTQIDEFGFDTIRGIYVNRSSYQQAVDEYNKLVEQYNSLIEERRARYTAYEAELRRVNNTIDRYNRGAQ